MAFKLATENEIYIQREFIQIITSQDDENVIINRKSISKAPQKSIQYQTIAKFVIQCHDSSILGI